MVTDAILYVFGFVGKAVASRHNAWLDFLYDVELKQVYCEKRRK